MRKKLSLLLVVAMMAVSFTACGDSDDKSSDEAVTTEAATEEETADTTEEVTEADTTEASTESATEAEAKEDAGDAETIYKPVLDETLDLIKNGYSDGKEYKYLSSGVQEEVNYGDSNTLLTKIGYTIKDINGDSIPELLVGSNQAFEDTQQTTYIYAGYTLKDGQPVMFLDGWARSSYQVIDDGGFYHYGSGGAMTSGFGVCHLEKEGTSLVFDDFYFTDMINETESGFFHNTTGDMNQDTSEKLDETEEEFWAHMNESNLVVIDLIPFEKYGE